MTEREMAFVPPPEAPVYEPTEEEFADPLAYIAKIRPEAELCGICKIRPPPDWQPPFAVDVDNFKFVPRVQRLNELEAKTRVKLNFLDSIAKFWELQGCRLRLPYVNAKSLDLFNLNKIVKNLGGFEVVCRDKKWSKVAGEMGYPPGKNIGHQLGKHYERIIWPYDVFQSGIPLEEPALLPEGDAKEKDYEPHGIISRQAIRPNQSGYSRRSKRQAPEGLSVDITNNSELKKLQLYGPGPKFQGLGLVVDNKNAVDKTVPQEGILEGDRQKAAENESLKAKLTPTKKSPGAGSSMQMRTRPSPFSLIETYMCHMCGKGDAEECLLLCDGCDDSFHTFCLLPPLPEVPKGDWRCPKCLAVACNKKKDPFGFEQAGKEFTLESFGKMADQFKKDYFNMPVHMVPPEQIEKEFWRLVTAIDEDVSINYGADIHSLNQGSGFPTKNTKNLAPEDEEYVHSGWNLNNLPVQDASVLHHINVDISGMKVPWMYVGMCFAAFCWHNEDHWSYSINYLHWGEPKTWYGVSGHNADLFENVMRDQAPELFCAQPDLLHQLVTIMSPTLLMKNKVPIHRTNQCAGEFVITFPRAYHAGFNQGYNFAEAVNFCPVDWLPWGGRCIEDYRRLHRFCVFSHEELIAKMAANPESLDLNLAAAVHKELLNMVEVESKLRKGLLERGTTKAEREAFELLPDDERQCDYCKTTCFLSACTCPCTPNKLVCIHHVDKLCDCNPNNYCLRYRYTLDELPAMLHRLKMRAESFDNWANKVHNALNPTDVKLDVSELKDMLEEADVKNFPENDSLQDLITAIAEAEKCSMIATQLINKKQKSGSGDEKFITRINLDELKGFVETVDGLPCSIKEATQLKDFLKDIENFISEVQEALEDAVPDSEKLQMLLKRGKSFDIELSEIPKLKQELIQARWLDEVRNNLSNAGNVTLELLRKLIDSGVNLAPHPAIEKAMTELQELLSVSERWEEKAKICLNAKPPHLMALVEALISESENIPARLPNTMALKEALVKAKNWTTDIEELQNGDHFPYLDHLEMMVSKARSIPVRLSGWDGVEAQATATRTWRDRAARTFIKKNTNYTLIEVLTPRPDIGLQFKAKIHKKKSIFGYLIEESMTEQGRDPAYFLGAYKRATETEITSMKLLRDRNRAKQRGDEEGAEPAGHYCICRKPVNGPMLRCELCHDWFHTLCVPVPRSVVRQQQTRPTNPLSANAALNAPTNTLQGPQLKETKFMCPLCQRSRRPKLETILSLLVSLQKLPVRLPEGESLQCLTERAMNWQDKAKQVLATPEVTNAYAQLAFMVDRDPDLQPHPHHPHHHHREKYIELSRADLEGIYADHGGLSPPKKPTKTTRIQDLDDDDNDLDDEDDRLVIDVQKDIGLSEHAYSAFSRGGSGGGGALHPKKQSRKSPLIPRPGTVKVELSPFVKAQLEELLIEGDLLEVSLEETQHIFKILKAAEPLPVATKMMEHFISHLTEEAYEKMMKVKSEHKQKRSKRKLSQEGSTGTPRDHQGSGPEAKKKKKKRDKERGEEIKMVEPGKKKAKLKDKSEPKAKLVMVKKDKEEPMIVVDGDEDDDEICSAKRCLQPAGDDINWVQCDKCEKWYHLLCIGMTSQPLEDEDYVCKPCVKRKTAQKAKAKQRAKMASQKADGSPKVKQEAGTTAPPIKEEVKPAGLVPVALLRVENDGKDALSNGAKPSVSVKTELLDRMDTDTTVEAMDTDRGLDPGNVDPISVGPISVDPINVDPVNVDPIIAGPTEKYGLDKVATESDKPLGMAKVKPMETSTELMETDTSVSVTVAEPICTASAVVAGAAPRISGVGTATLVTDTKSMGSLLGVIKPLKPIRVDPAVDSAEAAPVVIGPSGVKNINESAAQTHAMVVAKVARLLEEKSAPSSPKPAEVDVQIGDPTSTESVLSKMDSKVVQEKSISPAKETKNLNIMTANIVEPAAVVTAPPPPQCTIAATVVRNLSTIAGVTQGIASPLTQSDRTEKEEVKVSIGSASDIQEKSATGEEDWQVPQLDLDGQMKEEMLVVEKTPAETVPATNPVGDAPKSTPPVVVTGAHILPMLTEGARPQLERTIGKVPVSTEPKDSAGAHELPKAAAVTITTTYVKTGVSASAELVPEQVEKLSTVTASPMTTSPVTTVFDVAEGRESRLAESLISHGIQPAATVEQMKPIQSTVAQATGVLPIVQSAPPKEPEVEKSGGLMRFDEGEPSGVAVESPRSPGVALDGKTADSSS